MASAAELKSCEVVAWSGQQLGQVPVEGEQAEPARQAKGRQKQAK